MSVRQVPVLRTTNPWSLSTFCEGPRTLNEKITGCVLAILTSIASFFLLPKTGAILLTGALVVLCAAFCGVDRLESSSAQAGATMAHALPYLVNNYVSPPTYVQPISNLAIAPVVVTPPVFAPQRPAYVAPAEVSAMRVNGQPQVVSDPGARMVAGTGQIVAPPRPPARVVPDVFSQFQPGIPYPSPQTYHGGNHQPRAVVGRPNT